MRFNLPQLFVIAGPNGAGKSATSAHLLKPYGIKAFDWDKEFHQRLSWQHISIAGITRQTQNSALASYL